MISLPTYYGYESYASNGGSCQNAGYEFSIYGKPVNRNFKWEDKCQLFKIRQ